MNVTVMNQSQLSLAEQNLIKWLEFVASALVVDKVATSVELEKELLIVFMDEAPAQKLNFDFRKRNYPTDVLSFDAIEPDSLGELVLCSQVVARQAEENQHDFLSEAAYLTLHGLLHLLGYDHETNDSDAEKMYSIQDRVFARLNEVIPEAR